MTEQPPSGTSDAAVTPLEPPTPTLTLTAPAPPAANAPRPRQANAADLPRRRTGCSSRRSRRSRRAA